MIRFIVLAFVLASASPAPANPVNAPDPFDRVQKKEPTADQLLADLLIAPGTVVQLESGASGSVRCAFHQGKLEAEGFGVNAKSAILAAIQGIGK